MRENYRVEARQWAGGWELWLDGECITQSRTLAGAGRQVADYLETVHEGESANGVVIVVDPVLDGAAERARDAKVASVNAAAAQVDAAVAMRASVHELRDRHHLSVTDIAFVLDVSRSRVSQLLADPADESNPEPKGALNRLGAA